MAILNGRSNTSNNRPSTLLDGQINIQQADGILFTKKVDGSIRSTLLPKRTAIADVPFQVRIFDTYLGVASLTAPRTLALPLASLYPPGHPLTITDESGAASPTVPITLAAMNGGQTGGDAINGNPTLAISSAYTGVVLYSDGTSKWTAIALPAGAAANALLYVAQTITAGQQDQARLNVGGAVPASPSATTPLAALDFERGQLATGTTTLTVPANVPPGWRTGIITNANASSGAVTLAVPTGHTLDGNANGSTTLLPRQRARLQMITAGAWITDWVDRTPIVASRSFAAVASTDFPLPTGYAGFEFDLRTVAPNTATQVNVQFSDDNGATFKNTVGYYVAGTVSDGTTASAFSGTFAGLPLIYGHLAGAPDTWCSAAGLIVPGDATRRTGVQFKSSSVESSTLKTRDAAGLWNPTALALTVLRLVTSTGTMTGQFTARAIPAP